MSNFVEASVSEVEEIYREKRFYEVGKSIRLNLSGNRPLQEEEYVSIVYGDNEWNCDGGINHLVLLNKKEFVAVLVNVVENSKRLDSVYLAIDGIQKLTGKTFSPLGISEVSNWWSTAKDNKEYHSPHEELYKLNEEFNRCLSKKLKNKAYVGEYVTGLKHLIKRNPEFKPAHKKMLFALSFGYYEAEELKKDEVKSLYECSFAKCKARDFAKPEMYFICRLYFDILNEEPFKNVQQYLDDCPALEVVLKEGKFFNPELIKALKVNWPSERKKTIRVEQTSPVDERSRKKKSLDSTGGVGYVLVSIEKGKRVLAELPFKHKEGFSKEMLSSKNAPSVLRGDTISWTIDFKEYRYTYNGNIWIDKNGNDASMVAIPVGSSAITYERTEDKKTSLAFSGWMEFN